ncbi:hypothetical protein B0A56_00630 [Flavobacterium columnare NBRC 100251 = ATCC 23463]|nr:hypothetical protein B0A56_00630 [Flavobacterium columnare NBRC 100251 = ATCC 23463]
MKRIKIHPDMSKRIAQECKTTRQTVYASLCYFNNSDLGLKIRKRALELLQEEINNNQEA